MPGGLSFAKQAGGIAVVTMAKEPANTMSMDFWRELHSLILAIEADREVRAIVFLSGLQRNLYAAGLDIKELYPPTTSKARLAEFWDIMSRTMIKLYTTPLMTIAAIKGAAPAGACGLSMCCDYRIITRDGTMGLNEAQLGMTVPWNWTNLLVSTVGQRQAEKLLFTGDMPPAPRLLEIGLVDAVVEGPDALLPAALQEARRWLKNPDFGRAGTKQILRGPLAQRWAASSQDEAAFVWAGMSDPKVVDALKKVLERLSGGSKKAAASKL